MVLSELPLSITTAPNSVYRNVLGTDGVIRYRSRGADPDHPDHHRPRLTLSRGTPLIYLIGIAPGKC